jgi:hypothetical protein
MKKKRTWIILLLVAASAVAGFWLFSRTLTYSLWRMESALKNGDAKAFAEHVVVAPIVDVVLANEAKKMKGTARTREDVQEVTMKIEYMMNARDVIIKIIQEDLLGMVERGGRPGVRKDFRGVDLSIGSMLVKAGISTDEFKGVSRMEKDGNVANVGLEFSNGIKTSTVELKMIFDKGLWKVVEIKNLLEMLKEKQ